MRILHTADWHLGRNFMGISLLEDQSHILEQVFDAVKKYEIDALIVAGDVYEKPSPAEEAVKLFSSFVEKVYEKTKAVIIVIAGNHDSGERIGALARLLDPKRILIRGPLRREEQTLVVDDEYGSVAFSALPYGGIYSAKKIFGDETIKSPEDVLRLEIEAARASKPKDARWVVVAHAFVTGGKPSEGERPLSVGTVEHVPYSLFEGADYTALGHLHRAQVAGKDTIRYSGSPMAFGFDEVDDNKTMTIIELDAQGVSDCKQLQFSPKRKVREVRGILADLVVKAQANPSEDYIRAVLLDEGALVDPISQLRPYYPNILQIAREKKTGASLSNAGRAQSKLDEPKEVINEFVEFVRGQSMSDTEINIVEEILDQPTQEKV